MGTNEPTPRERFERAQDALCTAYGLEADSRLLSLDLPDELPDRVHCLVAGSGDPILFLPGATQPAAVFAPLMAELVDEHRCIAVDRPGEGLTDMIDYGAVDYREMNRTVYPAVLDELGHDRVDVVGHSQGGIQTFLLAFDAPDRVDRLCLVGAPGGLTASSPLLFRLLAVPYLNRLLIRFSQHDAPEDVREDWDGWLVGDASAIPRELLEIALANESLSGRVETQASLAESLWSPLQGARSPYVFPDRVRELPNPTLFVWGTEDFYLPPSVGEPIAEDMSDATFVTIDGHGYSLWLEPDERASDELQSFL